MTQKAAWFMGHRIRTAIHVGSFDRLLGEDGDELEVDETFIGGKARNMHADVKARRIAGRGPNDKTAVLGMPERGGVVTTKVVCDRKKRTLQKEVKATVAAGSALYSDDSASYDALSRSYAHETVNHAIEYVRCRVHTNGMEKFWSLLKRALSGTYVSVEPFHLHRYLDKQAYRYNQRKLTNGERFLSAVFGIFGRRLTYDQLRGRDRYRTPELWAACLGQSGGRNLTTPDRGGCLRRHRRDVAHRPLEALPLGHTVNLPQAARSVARTDGTRPSPVRPSLRSSAAG